jgi:hypothetical protein
MTKKEKEDIERLIVLTEVDMSDKHLAQYYVRTYINEGFKCCMTCDPAVRGMFKILKNWWNGQKAYQFIKPLKDKK